MLEKKSSSRIYKKVYIYIIIFGLVKFRFLEIMIISFVKEFFLYFIIWFFFFK